MHETFEPANPDYRTIVTDIFQKANFIASLGIQLGTFGPGWCETALALEQRHLQQDGFAHAGLVATMADHTSGAAAGSLIPAGQIVLTVEYKINLLRPGVGTSLFSRADVIRNGRKIVVSESSVFTDGMKLIAKGLFTLAIVPAP